MLNFGKKKTQDVGFHPRKIPEYPYPITPENIEKLFSGCEDFISRYVSAGGTKTRVFVCWLDGTVNGSDIASLVLRPLTDNDRFGAVRSAADVSALLADSLVFGDQMTQVTEMDELCRAISFGNCAIVLRGEAFIYQFKTDQHRSVQEPTVEKTVKGSKDAFVEPLRINTGLVRSRLHTPKLSLKQTVVGRDGQLPVAVMWVDGVAAPDLPKEMLRRLDAIDVDGVLFSDKLESCLVDSPKSPMPQLIHTEKPDKFVDCLLEGRVGLLVDGIPIGYLAPASLAEFMMTNEDNAQQYLAASAVRILRWIALFLTLLLPAFYVALATYHPEMLPLKLLSSVIQSKQSVPFSTAVEILGMLVSFELLQEAGLRLPDPIGQTVSIIGALIVGQSAVEAKVISPIAVIVVAFAGIAGFTMPSQDLGAALRLFRFMLVLAAMLAGMFGIVVGLVLIIWHICSLESFGRAYTAALSGSSSGSGRAPLIRKPPWKNLFRDKQINGGNLRKRK